MLLGEIRYPSDKKKIRSAFIIYNLDFFTLVATQRDLGACIFQASGEFSCLIFMAISYSEIKKKILVHNFL